MPSCHLSIVGFQSHIDALCTSNWAVSITDEEEEEEEEEFQQKMLNECHNFHSGNLHSVCRFLSL